MTDQSRPRPRYSKWTGHTGWLVGFGLALYVGTAGWDSTPGVVKVALIAVFWWLILAGIRQEIRTAVLDQAIEDQLARDRLEAQIADLTDRIAELEWRLGQHEPADD